MRSLFSSAFALTIIAIVVLGLSAGCGVVEAEPINDQAQHSEAPEAQGSFTTLDRYAFAPQLDGTDGFATIDPPLIAAYFAEPLGDIESTFDGGFHQWWGGNEGRGALYAHPVRTRGKTHFVYGEILTLWTLNGAEGWIGYPLDEERDAGWGCAKDGALREQTFTAGIEAPGYHRVLCWAPGEVWTFEWVDDGAALTRLPPVQRGPAAN